MVFKFGEIGVSLGTRKQGIEIREKLLKIINNSNKTIVLDFSNVTIVSNSFADVCFGKLILQVGLENFKSKTTFRNYNLLIGKVIRNSIVNRLDRGVSI